MKKVKDIFESTSLLFSLAIVLGLAFPRWAQNQESLIVFFLIVAMTFSLRKVKFRKEDIQNSWNEALKLFAINYGFLSFFIIALSYFLINDPSYFRGFVVLAAVPPAIAIAPFTYLLGGNLKKSMLGKGFSYLASLFLMPFIILVFIGTSVKIFPLIKNLVIFIILPLVLSRLLSYFETKDKDKSKQKNQDYSKIVINLSLFMVVYLVTGTNQYILTTETVSLLPVFLVVFLRTFVAGTLVFFFAKNISYSLFGAYKNIGLATVISISLFNDAAAIPAAVSCVFETLFIVFFRQMTALVYTISRIFDERVRLT